MIGLQRILSDVIVEMKIDEQCCFVDEHGTRCSARARFWIGRTFLDASYGCGDHVEDLKEKEQTVIRLEDGKVIE